MRTITASELGRKMREVLDSVEFRGEEVIVVRNEKPSARLSRAAVKMTALDALGELYETLPEDAAQEWLVQSNMSSAFGGRWE